jgi:hypothetical protein
MRRRRTVVVEAAAVVMRRDAGTVKEVVCRGAGMLRDAKGRAAEMVKESAGSGEAVVFDRHRPSFAGEMENRWSDWVAVLYMRACKEELGKMHSFQVVYEPILAEKLAM